MMHSREQEVLAWLSMRSRSKDRVVYNALNNHQCRPTVHLGARDSLMPISPVVTATSRSGREYRIQVYLHPVTGEPHSFCRLKDEEEGTPETIAL